MINVTKSKEEEGEENIIANMLVAFVIVKTNFQ